MHIELLLTGTDRGGDRVEVAKARCGNWFVRRRIRCRLGRGGVMLHNTWQKTMPPQEETVLRCPMSGTVSVLKKPAYYYEGVRLDKVRL